MSVLPNSFNLFPTNNTSENDDMSSDETSSSSPPSSPIYEYEHPFLTEKPPMFPSLLDPPRTER